MYDPAKPYKTDIQKLIQQTWKNPYIEVKSGTYPVLRRKFSDFEVDHTDGIGTKGYYHWKAETFRAAVVDALAMNLNDLALMRAIPYKMSNHITVPKEDERVFKIVQAMVKECKSRKIAMVGGENSFHDNLDGLDISMTVSGIVKKLKPNRLKSGDILIGLKSSGLHSNGITTVRRVLGEKLRPEFTIPTTIYLDSILKLDKKCDIHGMMHITGGAFTKLKDLLDKSDAIIDTIIKPQLIFKELYAKGVKDQEMYKTFNCGIGFVIAVSPKDVAQALKITKGKIIGKVVKGSGKVKITSAFSGRLIEY